MSALAVWLPTSIVVAVAMDLWAALLHGKVWHAWLWGIHRSHHEARRGRFEWNDVLSTLHAPLAIALILWGCVSQPGVLREVAFGTGIGMTAFGLSYLIVHDGLVHRRLPVRGLLRVGYIREVARAHRVHHTGVRGGAPYGFFLGPLELARHRRRAASITPQNATSTAPHRNPTGSPSTDRARA